MSLYERARAAQGDGWGSSSEALKTVRHRVHQRVIEELGSATEVATTPEDLRRRVQQLLQIALRDETTPMSAGDRIGLIQDLTDDILGNGPIEPFLRDPSVSEVMVNGPDQIYVEHAGKLVLTDSRFIDESQLRRVVERIVAAVGRRIDESSPMVDARLPDGSRVNAIYPPLSITGPYLTVRKFPADPLMDDDLIRMGTITPQLRDFLHSCIAGKLNVLVSGGTSTGKTTLLNVLSSFIPEDERIITIEDSKELQLHQDHVLSLESRPPNTEGRGEVTIRDLVRNSLRMRPDRIIVGEVRSAEALDMLQAMNTGHEGSITTVHANSPRDAMSRIETMTLMAGFDLPIRAIRDQMSSALDIVIHLSRLRDGTRRVTHVTEIERMEGDVIVLQDLFLFDYGMGLDDEGRSLGTLKSTGLRPKFAEKLADNGYPLDVSMFDSDAFVRAPVGRR
jgi:pilus assembly protein CpaF